MSKDEFQRARDKAGAPHGLMSMSESSWWPMGFKDGADFAYEWCKKDFLTPAPSGSACYGCKQREVWHRQLTQQADALAKALEKINKVSTWPNMQADFEVINVISSNTLSHYKNFKGAQE